jgi:glucose-6-phosphate 1-dehydrogenase
MSSPRANPSVFVIFGASGDLTRRKLLPAIYNLAESQHLPDEFAILGVARPRIDVPSYRAQMRDRVRAAEGEPLEPQKWAPIEERLYYVSGEFDNPSLYAELQRTLEEIRARHHVPPNYLFYLAVPPDLFAVVVKHLAEAGLMRENEGWRRVIVEKPFGYDLASARALNAEFSTAGLRESQIYRIDHYLGKETVQNIMAFRFANGIFEPIWNRRYVDHVQMTVAEEVGVERRGAYYDRAGALRDMVQNHMFQLLTLVAMEPPISFRAEDVRDERVKMLHAVTPFDDDNVRRCAVRGQYLGYRGEPDVAPTSRTESYVALKLLLDNWRWAGVPFYLRTGKRLPRRVTQIAVQFKPAPFTLFRETPVACTHPNRLTLGIQPEESICLSFDAKVPGPLERLETVNMEFAYQRHFKVEATTGYETLLFDAMAGDQTLFHRMDMVEAGWQVVQPILDAWANDTASPLPVHEPGTWGPSEGDLLIERDGREWRT